MNGFVSPHRFAPSEISAIGKDSTGFIRALSAHLIGPRTGYLSALVSGMFS